MRPAEILTALRRLGYVDKPSIGDHVSLFKLVEDHPAGPTTIQTGIDMGQNPVSKHDIARIQRQTKLKGGDWTRALGKKLTQAEYDEKLRSMPKSELVHPFWRHLVSDDPSPRGGSVDDA